MTITHSFHSELPSGQSILVEAEITPPVPGRMYGEPGDCYPDEHGSAEIESVQLTSEDNDGNTILTDLDISDLWTRYKNVVGEMKFRPFDDELADAAYESWENDQ